MGWFDLTREPELEVMDDSDEVQAYASAAAQAFLDRIDDTFVDHAERLVRGRSSGLALDIGTGPGQIVLKLAGRLPGWRFMGVDRSANMIGQAIGNARAPEFFHRRVGFFIADGNRLPFPDGQFDLITSNSVLHHLARPLRLLAEVARLVKTDGAVLIRDLRRPSRLAYPLHVRRHGRHYSGLMYKLFCASVRSSYTLEELACMLGASALAGDGTPQSRPARVFVHSSTHLGIERPAT